MQFMYTLPLAKKFQLSLYVLYSGITKTVFIIVLFSTTNFLDNNNNHEYIKFEVWTTWSLFVIQCAAIILRTYQYQKRKTSIITKYLLSEKIIIFYFNILTTDRSTFFNFKSIFLKFILWFSNKCMDKT